MCQGLEWPCTLLSHIDEMIGVSFFRRATWPWIYLDSHPARQKENSYPYQSITLSCHARTVRGDKPPDDILPKTSRQRDVGWRGIVQELSILTSLGSGDSDEIWTSTGEAQWISHAWNLAAFVSFSWVDMDGHSHWTLSSSELFTFSLVVLATKWRGLLDCLISFPAYADCFSRRTLTLWGKASAKFSPFSFG